MLKAGFSVYQNMENNSINSDISNILNQKLINNNEKDNSNKSENAILNWYIEIPCINLKAEIAEGTSKEVMEKYIGHFEETKKTDGNIGLAAHNRGYEKNYFSDIKKLKEGDKIFYKYQNFTKEYEVISNFIIKDTDWTNLLNTEDNRITLITCVENEPEYRRCIQGICKKSE